MGIRVCDEFLRSRQSAARGSREAPACRSKAAVEGNHTQNQTPAPTAASPRVVVLLLGALLSPLSLVCPISRHLYDRSFKIRVESTETKHPVVISVSSRVLASVRTAPRSLAYS